MHSCGLFGWYIFQAVQKKSFLLCFALGSVGSDHELRHFYPASKLYNKKRVPISI